MYKPLTQNIQARCLVWYFNPRIIPETSHKLRSFWAGLYRVIKLIALVLAEIKLVYYPGEKKLVSLDVLKLYWGEDVVCQNTEDVDPDRWLDEGELTEPPEIPIKDTEVRVREQPEDQRRHELYPEPDLDIHILPKDPEAIAEREGIHKRIQSVIQHEDKEAEAAEEVMLEIPPEWNAFPALIMEDKEMIMETDTKEKRDEVA